LNHMGRYLAMLILVLASSLVSAADNPSNVLVIADLSSDNHQDFIDTLQNDDATGRTLKVIDVASFDDNFDESTLADVRLMMPVGVNALRSVVDTYSSLPVWAALVPKRSYEALIVHSNDTRRYSAWFVDQPLSRRFDLLKIALPAAGQVGVLIGESPDNVVQALKDAAAARSFELIVRRVKDEQDAVAKTQKLGESVDVILAVPDRVSLNLNNAKGILLSAYRQRLPIVGYTRASVSAGALAAVYSMPGQIARHMSEELKLLVPNKEFKPDRHYPKYFSVAVNTQVARSLGIQLPSQASLLTQLKEME